MTLRTVPADAVAPSRWRNGGGWTRELCAWPAPDDWIARVSVADIEADGPFSAFPGTDRWFAVLDGDGVELAHDGGAVVRLTPGDALHRFRGDAPTACRLLGGTTRDFNLMVRRDRAQARVVPLAAGEGPPAGWSGCFATAPVRVRTGANDAWQALPARTLAWTTAPSRLAIDPDGDTRGWRIEVHTGEGR